MKVTLQIPDSLGEGYQNAALPGKSLEETLVDQLVKFAAARPGEKFIILNNDQRERLDKALNCVPIASAIHLVKAVEDFAEVSIGGVKLYFTLAQRRELQNKADRMRMTLPQYLDCTVRVVLENHILDASPRPGEMLQEQKEPVPAAAGRGGR